jgi:hypothetical protein
VFPVFFCFGDARKPYGELGADLADVTSRPGSAVPGIDAISEPLLVLGMPVQSLILLACLFSVLLEFFLNRLSPFNPDPE